MNVDSISLEKWEELLGESNKLVTTLASAIQLWQEFTCKLNEANNLFHLLRSNIPRLEDIEESSRRLEKTSALISLYQPINITFMAIHRWERQASVIAADNQHQLHFWKFLEGTLIIENNINSDLGHYTNDVIFGVSTWKIPSAWQIPQNTAFVVLYKKRGLTFFSATTCQLFDPIQFFRPECPKFKMLGMEWPGPAFITSTPVKFRSNFPNSHIAALNGFFFFFRFANDSNKNACEQHLEFNQELGSIEVVNFSNDLRGFLTNRFVVSQKILPSEKEMVIWTRPIEEKFNQKATIVTWFVNNDENTEPEIRFATFASDNSLVPKELDIPLGLVVACSGQDKSDESQYWLLLSKTNNNGLKIMDFKQILSPGSSSQIDKYKTLPWIKEITENGFHKLQAVVEDSNHLLIVYERADEFDIRVYGKNDLNHFFFKTKFTIQRDHLSFLSQPPCLLCPDMGGIIVPTLSRHCLPR